MSLEKIPPGSLCVVDTNVLLHAEHGTSQEARRLLARVREGELRAVLPQPVWQELTHKLMIAEARGAGLALGANAARRLSARPELVRRLGTYREKVQALVRLGVGFEPCGREDVLDAAFALQRRYGLLTNDSVLLAASLRLKADALATADEAFSTVTEIGVYRPSDVTAA